MGDERMSRIAFRALADEVEREGGPVSKRGEERQKKGEGLHPLVDPSGYGVIRRSLYRLDEKDGRWVMTVGPSMLVERQIDTTASMADNVDLIFKVVPKSYDLLHEVPGAPLRHYDLHVANGIFGDVKDAYVYCRSQAEMTIKIAEQLREMVPCRDGHDVDEDPQYGLFAAAYLTRATIVKAGLKTYHFTVTDARGRDYLDSSQLVRIFGKEVWDKAKLNGFKIDKDDLPTTKQVVKDLLEISHAFVIQVRDHSGHVNQFWTELYGKNRVIKIPSVQLLPETEAAICGLTEGTLNLQNVEEFLIENAQISEHDAELIKNAVAKIPIGAQAKLPNFNKLPKKGDLFASKNDVWPIDHEFSDTIGEAAKPGYTPNKPPPKKKASDEKVGVGKANPGWL